MRIDRYAPGEWRAPLSRIVANLWLHLL